MHWLTLALILRVWLAPAPIAFAALAVSATGWLSLYLAGGLGAEPGPALRGWMRRLHPWQHRGLYAGLALSTLLCLVALAGRGVGLLHDVVGWMVAAGSLHAAFHIWRHIALRDGALRRMTPRAVHGLL